MGFTKNNVGAILNGYVHTVEFYREQWLMYCSRYEEICPLNSGAFGSVSLARDVHSDTLVAVKCVAKPTGAGSDARMKEIYQEMQVHEALRSHPNIVNLLDTFETATHFYLVLEYCADGDMYDAIDNGRGPNDHLEIKAFMLQLVCAVEHMHSKGLYHRDIKPENVFLTENGTVKLGDFGLATREKWTDEANVGSERYMAPEQYSCASGMYQPEKADIWAVGICLLNVLFHKAPFAVPNESDRLFKDFVQDRQSLYDMFPTMSEETFNALEHCLALDPSRRSLENFREAIFDLKSWTTDDEDDIFADDYVDEYVEDLDEPSPAYNFKPAQPISWTHRLEKPVTPLTTPHFHHNTSQYDYFGQVDTADVHLSPEQKWSFNDFAPSSIDSGLGLSLPASVPKKSSLAGSKNNSALDIPQMKVEPATPHSKKFATSWSDLVDEEEEEEEAREAELLRKKRMSWSFEADKHYYEDDDAVDWVGGYELSL